MEEDQFLILNPEDIYLQGFCISETVQVTC